MTPFLAVKIYAFQFTSTMSSMVRRTPVYLGIIAPIGFILGVIVLGSLTPEYSHVYHTISELGEVGAAYGGYASVLFALTGLMLASFGLTLHEKLPKRESGLTSGICIIVYALADFVGSGLFPVDPGGAADTVTASYHVTLTVIGELAALAMPILFLMETEGENSWEQLRKFSKKMVAVSIPAAAFLVYNIERNIPGVNNTPIGLAQRIMVGIFLAWITGAAFNIRNRK